MAMIPKKTKASKIRGLRTGSKQHPATKLVWPAPRDESSYFCRELIPCSSLPQNQRFGTRSVDPTGFEPASATVAGCCVSVTPRAQAESTSCSARSQVFDSHIEKHGTKTGINCAHNKPLLVYRPFAIACTPETSRLVSIQSIPLTPVKIKD